jgi:hypothetical protein
MWVTKEITLSGGLFADADFDFDARLAIGAAACGIGDIGFVLATLDRIVDASALTGYGVSQGGYWITRAIAFEHRTVADVADPGAVDVSEGWTKALSPPVLELLRSAQKVAFNAAVAKASADPAVARAFAFRSKPYGVDNGFDLFTEVEKYQLRDVVAQITTPLLVLDPQDEQFFPGQP